MGMTESTWPLRSCRAVCGLAISLIVATSQAQTLPPALEHALFARSSETIRTGEVEFYVTDHLDRGSHAPITRFFSWTCAGDRVRQIDRGDHTGLTVIWKTGTETREYRDPVQYLLTPDELWVRRTPLLGSPPEVHDRESGAIEGILDFRNMGSNPADLMMPLSEFLSRRKAEGGGDFAFETTMQDELHVVTARDGDTILRWHIDAAKDWSIVRTALLHAGKLQYEIVFSPALVDGHWMPGKVEIFRRAAGETSPAQTFEVISARLNRPDQRQELAPADIGIEPGATVLSRRSHQRGRGFRWTGSELVDPLTFAEMLYSGNAEIAPSILREARRRAAHFEYVQRTTGAPQGASDLAGAPVKPPASRPTLIVQDWESVWARYTREFIARHGLTDDQTPRAWSISRDCESKAVEYLNRHREALLKSDERIRTARQQPESAMNALLKEAEAERDRLLEPLNRLFEDQFRPRLEKLLTRSQREASQPGTDPARPAATEPPAG